MAFNEHTNDYKVLLNLFYYNQYYFFILELSSWKVKGVLSVMDHQVENEVSSY